MFMESNKFIGPIHPETNIMETFDLTCDDKIQNPNGSSSQNRSWRNQSSNSSRDNYPRSRYHDRNDRQDRNDRRNDRSRSDRNRSDRRNMGGRKSKWDNPDNTPSMDKSGQMMEPMHMVGQQPGLQPLNPPPFMRNMPMMPGIQGMQGMQMMQFPQMMNNMMPQQPLDVPMPGPMQNMMVQNMMPKMDDNMMMMNQMVPNPAPGPIFTSCAVMLPPLPGVSTPERRDKPKGCRTIFVGGLPVLHMDVLKEIFQRFGPIEDVRSPNNGVYYVRFLNAQSVETSFIISGYRFKLHDQTDNEATTMFIDYALNREDQKEYELENQRVKTPVYVEPFTKASLTAMSEKIKSETDFPTAAPTLTVWLSRGECNKQYANIFYSLVQAANNHVRRLFSEKMQLDEEFQDMKTSMKERYIKVLQQFEQVAKIMTAANHQRVADHFTKPQRRNVEMWLKMTEELENIKEEFTANFDEEGDFGDPTGKKDLSTLEELEELKQENETLAQQLEVYKNQAHLAKDEAERKFEKFKAQYIAQQALQNNQFYPPLPPPPATPSPLYVKPQPPVEAKPPSESVTAFDAKLISMLTAYLLVHPLGVTLDKVVAYIRSLTPSITQGTVLTTLQKYSEIFICATKQVEGKSELRWVFQTFEAIKNEE